MNIEKKELLSYLSNLYKIFYESYPEVVSEEKRRIRKIESAGFLKVINLISGYDEKTAKQEDVTFPPVPSGFEVHEAERKKLRRPYSMIDNNKFISENSKFINPINIMEENKGGMLASNIPEGRALVNRNFGQAIEALKAGKRVSRKGWNGKGMFLFLLPAGTVPVKAIHDPALREVIEKEVGCETFEALGSIRMFTADKKILTGWLASQTDMLAEDWEIFE